MLSLFRYNISPTDLIIISVPSLPSHRLLSCFNNILKMATESDFVTACGTGDVEAVTRTLEKEVVSDDQLQKGLSEAAWGGYPGVADILLSKGAKVDRMSFLGSANRGDPTMFELFIKYGFDINSTEFGEGTALRYDDLNPPAMSHWHSTKRQARANKD